MPKLLAETLIVLDPGHGGEDHGAIGVQSAAQEKNVTLDLALQLGKMLQADPSISVVYCRNADIPIDLTRRAEIANCSQGTLLLSIHVGASPNSTTSGPRVYFFGEAPPLDVGIGPSDLTPLSSKGRPSESRRSDLLRLIPWGQSHGGFDSASNDLASTLQLELNALYGVSHQVQAIPLHLLKCTAMPSAIVEVGYLSNPKDDRRLQTPEFRGRITDSLKIGILNYLAHARRLNLRDH